MTIGGKLATYKVEIKAKEETGDHIISAFSSLADSIKTQTVTLGTAISTLPQKLKAVVDGISNTFVNIAKWVSGIILVLSGVTLPDGATGVSLGSATLPQSSDNNSTYPVVARLISGNLSLEISWA